MPKRDGPFQIIEKINDNAYKVNFLSKYRVSATFNVFDLSLFYIGDVLRLNPLEDRGDDATQPTPKDPLVVLVGAITRATVNKFKEAFNGFLQDTWAKMDYKKTVQEEQALINLIHIEDRLEDHKFQLRE
jgi:hypothetical protein